jgi:hypothetical protein
MRGSWFVALLLLLSVVAVAGDVSASSHVSPNFVPTLTSVISSIHITGTFTVHPTFTAISSFHPTFTFTFFTTAPTSPVAAKTDWAVLSVAPIPYNPQAGDQVSLAMKFAPLSSTVSFPQSVYVQCQIDGYDCGGGVVTHYGPVGPGSAMIISGSTLWPATPGTHVLTWFISTTNDPNPGNNALSAQFYVQPPQGPVTITQQPTQTVPTLTQQTTVVQTSVQTVTPSTTPTSSSAGPSSILPQGYTLPIIVIGGLILLAIALLRRKGQSASPSPAITQSGSWFCIKCGTGNSSDSQFCKKCGTAKQ